MRRFVNPGGPVSRNHIIPLSVPLLLGCISTHLVPIDAASVGSLPASTPLEIRLCSPEDLGASIPARGFEVYPRVSTVTGDFYRVTGDTIVLSNPRLTQTDSGGLRPRTINLGRDAEVALALADQCGVQREQVHAAETAGRTVAGLYLTAVTLTFLGIAVIFLIMKAQGTNIGP